MAMAPAGSRGSAPRSLPASFSGRSALARLDAGRGSRVAGPPVRPHGWRSRGCAGGARGEAGGLAVESGEPGPAATGSLHQRILGLSAEEVRSQFPVLRQTVHGGKPLVYLDNAATSQKPSEVLSAMEEYYREYNANVHRGVHALSARATDRYEEARRKVASFVGCTDSREIVFTRNASEAINLVAYSWALPLLGPGDEVVLTVAEHHSNIVPWQLVAEKTGCVLRYAGLTPDGQVDIEDLARLAGPRTKLVAVGHVSNVLGAVSPVAEVVSIAKKSGAKVLLDACQSVPHMPVDVGELGVDFLVCSGHKMCAPTGIGFLWAPMETLEAMPPWQGGGEMIRDVYLEGSTFAAPPGRFEAGTPAICEAVGLGAACDYLQRLGMDKVHAFELEIGTYLHDRIAEVEGVTVYGPDPRKAAKASLATFNVEGLHPTDLSMVLDQFGVAVRSGHHCTQPLHRELGVSATARASLYFYNTEQEVDAFVERLRETIAFLKV